MDVLEIDAASNTGVDNVREVIIGSVAIAPARDRYKVFIIDEVHMLSGPAFNALLKTIEEPPPRVVFIMATTDAHKVPETISSRCQLFEFRTIATAKIAERLRLIADAEKVSISDDAIREIARAGDGSMRDAQSAFDQVISFAGKKIKTEDVEKALGLAGADVLARVMKGIAENNPAEALAIVDDVVMRGHNLRNFLRDVMAHLRDLLVVKVSGDAKILDSASGNSGALKQQADQFSESDLVRFFHSLAETETTLKEAANPRYQVEVALVKLMEMRRLASLNELVQRIAALETAVRTGKPPADSPSPRATPASSAPTQNSPSSMPAKSAASEVSASSEPAVTRGGADGSFSGQVKAKLEQKRRKLMIAALESATRAELEGDEFVVEFLPQAKHYRDTLSRPDNSKALREACADVCGREIGVRFVIKTDDEAAEPVAADDPQRRQKAKTAAAADPAVQQVQRTFGAEIIDVKLL
jgi:DNA polymerase-3 subunit gamma/tau